MTKKVKCELKCPKCKQEVEACYANKCYDPIVDYFCKDCYEKKYKVDIELYIKNFLTERGFNEE